MRKQHIVLTVMLAGAVTAILIGLIVLRQHGKATPSPKPENSQNQETQETETKQPEVVEEKPQIAGWPVYTNEKYGYTLQYPPNLQVGSVSGNSVLGEAQSPVKGYHVGPLVFVTLKGSLRSDGAGYFNSSYNLALHPLPPAPGEPTVACTLDKITNPNVIVKSVSCHGEGGPARYALIAGKDYDIFVDGYSKGFDGTDNGEFKAVSDYTNILATFKFPAENAVAVSSNNPTPSPNPSPTPNPPPTGAIQHFTIIADDSGATPSQISVPAGTIVEITFSVASANVYYGGLDFRSSVVNSGTIYSGTSKTISFTASNSFAFTPYWPASGVKKDYQIEVNVE